LRKKLIFNPMLASSWLDPFFLLSIKDRAFYLKAISEVWGVDVQSIAEIGVFEGRTSKLFRLLFPDAFLYLIDPWELNDEYRSKESHPISKCSDDYEKAYQSVKEAFARDPKVQILRQTSMDAKAFVPDQLDLVFIDGNHSYSHVKEDIENWYPKLRSGGIISGHDYDPVHFPEVVQAVDEFFPEGVCVGHDAIWLMLKI
jgi:hypothetical protein